jgi:peptidoglycan/xylan/chitin deacetylase (PgdA/CDA1 family)
MLVRAARDFAVWSVGAAGGFAALRWLQPDAVTILCYHSVVGVTLPRRVSYGGLHVSLETFSAHMEYLRRHYHVVPLSEIAAAARSGTTLPRRSVGLTFDDGYANNVTRAAPVLSRFHMRATLFLATDYIGGTDPFWWDELAGIISEANPRRYDADETWGAIDLGSEAGVARLLHQGRLLLEAARRNVRRQLLDSLGGVLLGNRKKPAYQEELRPATWKELGGASEVFEYGGHTAEHRVLDRLEAGETIEDLRRCRVALQDRLGAHAVPSFCYPAGRVTDAVATLVRGAGFTTAVTSESKMRLSRHQLAAADRWQLPRATVTAGSSTSLLAATIAGIPAYVRRFS